MTRTQAAMLTMAMAQSFACKPVDEEVECWRQALPRSSTIEIKVPEGGAGSARTADLPEGVSADQAALLGATADFYMFTRGISHDLNGGAAIILILVHAIVQYPV